MRTLIKYFFFAFVLLACKNISNKKNSTGVKRASETLDTIKTVQPGSNAKPALFETAFIQGTKQVVNNSTFTLYGVTVGKLKVPSGRIVACDPMLIEEYGIPFTQVFPTGEFPVQLSIAKFGEEELIAFARINFSDEPVERWEFALQKVQKPLPLGGEDIHGYVVDAGIGSFMDDEAKKVLNTKSTTQLDGALYKEMDKHYHNYWRYTIYNFGQHNMAAFSAGMGDGRYATYIGFNASGKPCKLLTDFALFNWKEN